MRLVLVHSPALGPSTWRWVAEVLRDDGHQVEVPDLRASVATGEPVAVVGAVTRLATATAADVVVGHSGAGPLLPPVAATTGAHLVFVDAGLPSDDGGGVDPFLDRLRALAVDGVLPPWSTWFGPGVLADLVPDPHRRSAIEADEPRVALAFYEAARPVAPLPERAGYIRLSDPYRPEAERAAALGWPVVEVPSGHLGLVTEPAAVARAVVADARLGGRDQR